MLSQRNMTFTKDEMIAIMVREFARLGVVMSPADVDTFKANPDGSVVLVMLSRSV